MHGCLCAFIDVDRSICLGMALNTTIESIRHVLFHYLRVAA